MLFSSFLHAQIITIIKDGSGDYTHIQQGVDAAANGDTVLVWPGIYIENVLIENKNIVLGSLALTTDSIHYVSQTVIDGNDSGSCVLVKFSNDKNLIKGLTLTGGSGYEFGPNMGGGICIRSSVVDLVDCIIRDNKVIGSGGGFYCFFSDVFLSGVTIKGNHAYIHGGGMGFNLSNVIFDSINLCNIYLNYAGGIGSDIFRGECYSPTDIILDTFTVLHPDRYYFLSYSGGEFLNDYTLSIQNGKIDPVSQDVYVSPQGSNSNTGIDPTSPLKDIWYAMLKLSTDSISPDTIHVASGTYSMSNGERFPLGLKKYVNIKGESRDSCILDAEDEIYHLYGFEIASNYSFKNFTLTKGNGWKNSTYGYSNIIVSKNPYSSFKNLLISNNRSKQACINLYSLYSFTLDNIDIIDNIGGVGLFATSYAYDQICDTIRLYNCHFSNNVPDYSISVDEGAYGGGMFLIGDYYPIQYSAEFYNCLFTNNHSRTHPTGGMSSNSLLVTDGAKAIAVNCTFGDNTSDNPSGANIGVTIESNLDIYNSILYNNNPAELYTGTYKGVDSLKIYNSLIQGGEEAIRVYTPGDVVYYDPSNMDTDPMWDTISMYPYSLSAGSPCIDAGTLNLPPWVDLPDTDLAGNPRVYNGYVDMGAYEYGPWVQTHEHEILENESFLSVWPNPFSYETNISYRIDKDGHCRINIYDLNGQLVKVLYDMKGLKGSGQITWNGKDQSNNPLKSGNYFINIIINGKEKDVIKVVKL